VEDEEGGEEEVEDIVGGEHGEDLTGLYAAGRFIAVFVLGLNTSR
jgi:hypothetical protein